MNIAGHIGFTLGALNLTQKGEYFDTRRIPILFVAAVALLPDIFDHSIHLVLHSYPHHGIFHSIFFYAAALPFSYLFLRPLLLSLTLMSFNVILDLANTELRAFLYPVYGWTGPLHGKPLDSPIETLLNRWPRGIGYKLPTGHYLIFEAIGALLALWVLTGRRTKESKV